MKFTDRLWSETTHLYEKIIHHPFNVELMQGTLDKEKFRFYICQDSVYLVEFAKALAIVAGRSDNADNILQFTHFAADAISVEGILHKNYFKKMDIEGKIESQPACFSYTNFLLAECTVKNYEEAIASLLPCFWIYREVGNNIAKHAVKNNFYQEWIDTYAGEDFARSVDKMLDITNLVAGDLSERMKQKMLVAYTYSSRYEYMFWDGAYNLETWI